MKLRLFIVSTVEFHSHWVCFALVFVFFFSFSLPSDFPYFRQHGNAPRFLTKRHLFILGPWRQRHPPPKCGSSLGCRELLIGRLAPVSNSLVEEEAIKADAGGKRGSLQRRHSWEGRLWFRPETPAPPPFIYQQRAPISSALKPSSPTDWHVSSPLPRLINAKRHYRSASRQGPQLRTGSDPSEKNIKNNNKSTRIVAVAFLNAYPLCSGNHETRDQRRRRIFVEISEGERTRKRPTGPNLQPKLTGHFVR